MSIAYKFLVNVYIVLILKIPKGWRVQEKNIIIWGIDIFGDYIKIKRECLNSVNLYLSSFTSFSDFKNSLHFTPQESLFFTTKKYEHLRNLRLIVQINSSLGKH